MKPRPVLSAPEPEPQPKKLHFVGSSDRDIRDMPAEVRNVFGHNLWLLQDHSASPIASPFEGSKAGDVMKLSDRFDGDTYRCVYAAKFEIAVYVLHVFKKKSKSGIATPQSEIDTVYDRLRVAKEHYAKHYLEEKAK